MPWPTPKPHPGGRSSLIQEAAPSPREQGPHGAVTALCWALSPATRAGPARVSVFALLCIRSCSSEPTANPNEDRNTVGNALSPEGPAWVPEHRDPKINPPLRSFPGGTIDVCSQNIICWGAGGGCPGRCRVLSSIPGLHPLGANSSCDSQTFLQRAPSVPGGQRSLPPRPPH